MRTRNTRNKWNKGKLLAFPLVPFIPRSISLSLAESCQGNPSLVIGIWRFVLKHVAAG
jgi:hypothetical protein